MKKIFYIILILISSNIFAQTREEIANVDILTYKYYTSQNWDSVIVVGKNALKNNIDYFYLRMRIGIAYYKKKKTIKAIPHFEKAYNFYKADTVCQEYLYYSYLFAGRKKRALLFAQNFSTSMKNRLDIKYKFAENAYFSSSYCANKDFNNLQNIDLDGTDNIYGEQLIQQNFIFHNLGYTLNLSPKINMYNSYGFMDINKTKQIMRNNDVLEFQNNVTQKQIFLGLDYAINKQLTFISAFNYSITNSVNTNYSETTNYGDLIYTFTDTVYDTEITDTILNYPNSKNSRYIDTKDNLNSYVGLLAVNYNTSIFNIDLSASFSNLNKTKQNQYGLSVIAYPFGNSRFFIGSKVFYQTENESIEDLPTPQQSRGQGKKNISKINRMIYEHNIGYIVSNKFWLKASVLYGNIHNFVDNYASDIYNGVNTTTYKADFSLFYSAFKGKMTIFTQFSYSEEQYDYLTYVYSGTIDKNYETTYYNQHDLGEITISEKQYTTKLINNKFNNYIITGGIKWNF